MLADGAGAAEPLSVASDSPDTVLPSVALAGAYAAGSILASAAVRTYYAVDVPATSSLQLRRRDGETDVPVLDDVAAFEVSYFGAPAPPALTVDASGQPHVTYGPAPVTAADGSVVPSCAFEVNDGHVASRLEARPGLADGLAALPLTAFLDGPWCPDATSSWRWDLDLARIRRLRLTVRTQASSAWLRGRDAAWFTRPGRARHAGRLVPDAGITFDVALRGLAR